MIIDIDFIMINVISGIFIALGAILVILAMLGAAHIYIVSRLEKNGTYETKKYIWTRTEKKKQ